MDLVENSGNGESQVEIISKETSMRITSLRFLFSNLTLAIKSPILSTLILYNFNSLKGTLFCVHYESDFATTLLFYSKKRDA